MKYLFYLGHPAHFHLFRNVIRVLESKGNQVTILIKKKDILEDLLRRSGMDYQNILPEGRSDTRAGIAWGLAKRDFRLLKLVLPSGSRPDLMIGTSVEISHIGRLLGIPSINVNEDDAAVVPLYSRLAYPFASVILSPRCCNNGRWESKTVKYDGYHELAYLHPDHFSPDPLVVEKYFPLSGPYFLLRFAKLAAHHDRGVKGISLELAEKIIMVLSRHGKVHISSERPLEPQLEPYRLNIDPLEIHHLMAFASLYIGDSQTMAAEAGVLGTPFIRINDFVGRIGYLNELENTYLLGAGFSPQKEKEILDTVEEWSAGGSGQSAVFRERREKMLAERINTADFLVKFIEDYTEKYLSV